MARRVGVDDEGAVQALVDVPLQRQRVAVVEVAAERLGVELVDELAAGLRPRRHPARRPCAPSGCRGSACVCGCEPPLTKWMRSRSPSVHAKRRARARGRCRSRPGRTRPARSRSPCPRRRSRTRARCGRRRSRRHRAGVPVGEDRVRVEAVAGMVDLADGRHAAMRGMIGRTVPGTARSRVHHLRCRCGSGAAEPGRCQRGGRQQAAAQHRAPERTEHYSSPR